MPRSAKRLKAALGVIALLASLTAASGAAAQESRDSISVLPGNGWPQKIAGSTDSAFTMSVTFGHAFTEHLAAELNLNASIFETDNPGATDFYQRGGAIDALYRLWPDDRWIVNPFVLAGLGILHDDFAPDTRDGTGLLAEAGIGFMSRPVYRGVRIRFDARWVRDGNDGGHDEYRGLLGIYIPIGTPPAPPAHTVEAPPRVEIREVVKEVPRPFIDTDGDGIDDEHDRCPGTLPGSRVDATGCVIVNQKIELKDITFELNSAVLTADARKSLDAAAPTFVGQRSMRAEVAGHTDGTGSAARNMRLSQQRAESVRSYLLEKGVRPEQLTAHGYGQTQRLVEPEASDADRARNRRVELRIWRE